MYKLKQIIDNIGQDRTINENIKVENGKVLLTYDYLQFKYEYGNWYQNIGGVCVNLQGGIPDYQCEELLDELLFKEEIIETLETP